MKITGKIRRSSVTIAISLFATFLVYTIVYARSGGISGRTLKTTTSGCSCHGSYNASTSVLVSGPQQVYAGQSATYTVTIFGSGKTGAGIDIAVRSGTLGVVSPELSILNQELVHTANIPASGGSVTLLFSYTAPSFATADTIFYTGNATNSNGNSTGDAWNWGQSFRVDVLPSPLVLNLNATTEGLYDPVNNTSVSDTLTIRLRNSTAPFALVESANSVMNSQGDVTANFPNAVNGVPYYLVVEHRNSIETWSALPVSFISGQLNYSFTSSSSQAYGNNLKLSGTKWTIYSGDANQDGTIDATDVSMVDNDAFNFASGYIVTDINGDGFVDGSDFSIADNNAANFVGVIRP